MQGITVDNWITTPRAGWSFPTRSKCTDLEEWKIRMGWILNERMNRQLVSSYAERTWARPLSAHRPRRTHQPSNACGHSAYVVDSLGTSPACAGLLRLGYHVSRGVPRCHHNGAATLLFTPGVASIASLASRIRSTCKIRPQKFTWWILQRPRMCPDLTARD